MNNNYYFDRVKLVIWDMDETFWKGTISEGEIVCPEKHILLIKILTVAGIVNSISSKNDERTVMDKLEQIENGLSSYFVFNNINWDEKGKQIKEKLSRMKLRAENVLFIDDNPRNLEEAVYINPGLMVEGPEIIDELALYVTQKIEIQEYKDIHHSRLVQYKLLETKTDVQLQYASNEQFLRDSAITVEINFDCELQIERIAELVERTNQLNYTKKRSNRIELEKLLASDWNRCAYITVKDKFGDYGVVGFFCYNRLEKHMEHFLFSCRVMGMGVEQYIYSRMGYPVIDVVKPVAVELEVGKTIDWISENTDKTIAGQTSEKIISNKPRILLKGPCDLSAIEQYLLGGSITSEFNFVNSKGFVTTGQNHSIHIFEGNVLAEEELQAILRDAPFLIREDFETLLFKNEYKVICYSLLPDCHAGVYRHKETGLYASFGSVNFDLTNEDNWEGYINGSLPNHFYPFSKEELIRFSDKWVFEGTTSEEVLIYNLEYMYDNAPGRPLFILLLGSEVEYEGTNDEFANHSLRHKRVNELVKEFAADKPRIKLINFTDYILTQNDYEDSINHFSRRVYYELATQIVSYINEGI